MQLEHSEVLKIFNKYNFKFPKTLIYTENKRQKISYPFFLKIDSKEVIHKSDLNLVYHISNETELKNSLKNSKKILKKNKIENYHFLLQESVKGIELIIGMNRDPVFGPVILFGLGGIFVELIKDTSLRIAPLKKSDCIEMIAETKTKKLFEGFRGLPKINQSHVIDILQKISKFAIKETNISQIDFNPVIVNEKGAYIVDARVIRNV